MISHDIWPRTLTDHWYYNTWPSG